MFYRLRKRRKSSPAVPGLTGDWTFNEGQCFGGQDSSGYDNEASLANVGWAPGRVGSGALWFNGGAANADGSRVWVSNANYRILPPEDRPFSVSFWFSPDAPTTGWRGLIGNDGKGSNGWHLALHTPGPGTNEIVFASPGPSGLSVTGRKLLLPGQWYQLTATYDGSQACVYIDSELLARGSGAIVGNDESIFFGGGVGSYDSFLGRIDEIRIYTNALAHEDISLTGVWHMDENSGTLIADSSIRGHHATASSSGAWVVGKKGAAIDLGNANIAIPNDFFGVLPRTGGAFSISFWLLARALPTDWSGLMSCANSNKAGWQLALSRGGDLTRFRFWSTESGGTLDLAARGPLTEDSWSKVDITYNGGIATLYINGSKVQSSSGGILATTAPLVLGAAAGMTKFDGIIDELKIYSRERTESAIGPVGKVMWETVLINTSSNLVLEGAGPAGKELTYTIVETASPTNGKLAHVDGSATVTYTAGARKGPDAFAYTVSDGEFTTEPTIVVVSVVEPHWLSAHGGTVPPLDGSGPDHAWVAGSADALDMIWHTNQYYDCFFYASGEYQTRGWKFGVRGTANFGCKHIGAGAEQTTLKLVDTWDSWNEGVIFASIAGGAYSDGFEVRDMLLDCNAVNNPKYAVGEPIGITIPLVSTTRVESITLHWDAGRIGNVGKLPNGRDWWQFGSAQEFSLCTRIPGTTDYLTNRARVSSTGQVDVVTVGTETDQIVIRLTRRQPSVDFYGLAEIEVLGGAVSLPLATVVGGGESRLNTNNAGYSILRAVDGNEGSVWASGPEEQVQLVLPLHSGTAVSRLDLCWNCQTIANVGRLGPAADYQIQARDPNSGQLYDVSYRREKRTASGLQINTFSNSVITDEIVIKLLAKELGVDFYSLRELHLQNESGPVALKLPSALNSLWWDNYYEILRAFDDDFSTQWASATQGMIGAIAVIGNNLKFTGLKVIGFGTKATRECFAMFIDVLQPWEVGPTSFGNVRVEDCVFTNPAPDNTDGVTTVWMAGRPFRAMTNAVVRSCAVANEKSYFSVSHAFSALDVENCVVTDCNNALYFEPLRGVNDNVGRVLIRSNEFLNVDTGISLAFHAGGQFDSLTMLNNEVVLNGSGGWGFGACDTCDTGPSGSITNVVALNNIVRYSGWSLHPGKVDGGFQASDMHNAVFGNNVVALGTVNSLGLRPCPAGYIPPPFEPETCDFVPPSPPGPGTYPPCLDILPFGYRRAWFNNRELEGQLLKVRYPFFGGDREASQSQWP